jgi:putative hydrolase of the HAD superfamily
MKHALILDLDNTIYPVSSIAERLFGKLFKLIDEGLEDRSAAAAAKLELTRRPYQHVADEFGFGTELKDKGVQLLNNLTFDSPMQAFSEYEDIRAINIDKYLVTTGFTKLQMSKVKMLNIEADFKQVYVVDPDLSDLTKKDIFVMIMKDNGYAINEVLVIGDDPQSEIKAALELGIDTFLFDPENKYPHVNATYRCADYKELAEIIKK